VKKKAWVGSSNAYFAREIADAKQRFLGKRPSPAKKKEAIV
jgi:hypothetical protein